MLRPRGLRSTHTAGPSTQPQRWARIRPEHARHQPAFIPGTWYPVLEAQPNTVDTPRLPGYMWVELNGQPRHTWAGHFEVRAEPRAGKQEAPDARPE